MPVVDALARLAEVFVIALGAAVGLAVIAAAGVAVHRVHHGGGRQALPVHPATSTITGGGGRRAAIAAPKQELHVHFHGVTAEDVAEALTRVNHEPGRGVK